MSLGPVPDEGTKLILPSLHQQAMIDAFLGTRREPHQFTLHEQAHKLSPEERRVRRVKNRAKRRKASAGRTASHTGREKALKRAKRLNRLAASVARKHPKLNARQAAKNMLKIETELLDVIETHITTQRVTRSTEVIHISGKLSIPEG